MSTETHLESGQFRQTLSPTALRALKTLDPALRQWIEEGHSLLTEEEHLARFGEPYAKKPRQR